MYYADRDSVSLEKSAIKEAEITVSSVDKKKNEVKPQDYMQNMKVELDRPEIFYETFKADRVK